METKGQLIDAVKGWVKLDNEIRNIQKIQNDLQYQPEVKLEDGLKRFFTWTDLNYVG